jgi:hypothetical protein
MLPLLQEGISGKSIFAQVPQDKLQEALVYLTSNFVDVKENSWKIIEKTVKRDNMVKGAVKVNVPAVFATTNRPGSPNTGASVWSQTSTYHSDADKTIATLRIDLDEMTEKCSTLETDKTALEKQIEEMKGYRTELEQFKEEQKEKEATHRKEQETFCKEQEDRDTKAEENLNKFQAQMLMITEENNRLLGAMRKGPSAMSQMLQSIFQTQPPADQSFTYSEGDVNEAGEWIAPKKQRGYTGTNTQMNPPSNVQTNSPNRFATLTKTLVDDDDKDANFSDVQRTPDTSFTDAYPGDNTTLNASIEEADLSTMKEDGENE